MSTSPMQRRSRNSLRAELPLILWLVVVWGALWGDWSVGNLVFGLILAVLVTRTLTLPPVRLSGRFNVLHFALFVVTFIWQVARASIHVFGVALMQGPKVHNAVLRVKLRQNNDLLMTAVGHTMALIPGSLVVEVDRGNGILYFHVLDVSTPGEAESFRESALNIEAAWIKIMGSKEDLAKLEASGDAGGADASGAVASPTTKMNKALDGRGEERP
ncbi:Na+/H+ antiporter subunit E [Kocuria marina subsp. indica]|uniref:Na+/H+ antiporter subunit E n=1 Tax=Kocuria TaxID=57493 RepID=UPI0010393D04|nr:MULTISPECIES: Na+/H+ antiporter subunit E [Kocuria]MDT0119712.1 Na+/H+ antiporter subunit E [Kocuria sp. PD6]QBJ20732.1 Na+/H+ antiporter subunit E [Kocuria indica]